MLELDQVAFRYPGSARDYRLTLSAAPGEITAISGPSGSGKSTLFDLIAGFLTPRSGTITLNGQTLVPLTPEARPISILLQAEPLFEHLSVAANLALALPRIARAEQQRRLAAALAEVGLAKYQSRSASTLSGGEKQRAALARTLLLDRPVLLLDEPFSALDDTTRHAMRQLVADLTRRKGWITILISHHADDVRAIARHHYRLENGQLVAATTPD
jgi:thiamine transport system ATP-binding protein